ASCACVGSAGSIVSKRAKHAAPPDSFRSFKLWLRIGLDLLRHPEFVRRLAGLSQRAVGLAEQGVGHIVSRIHRDRLIQVHLRHDRVLPFQQYLAQQNKRYWGIWFQQHGAIKRLLRLTVVTLTDVGIAQPVIYFAIKWIQFAFARKL